MPAHDWTRVDAGTFHDFHTRWVTHLTEALNGGLLPSGYYAMAEQWVGRAVADVLTLDTGPGVGHPAHAQGGVAVAETPPRVRCRLSAPPSPRRLQRTVAVRHVSGHRVVAIVEIVSPANKDRAAHVADFADKAESVLRQTIHLVLVDLLPPGPYDPQGMHAAVWERFDDQPYILPPNEPLTVASYVAGPSPEAYLEHLAAGSPLPEMPLFLNADRYINLPLEPTYLAAYRGMPAFWRDVLEGRQSAPS